MGSDDLPGAAAAANEADIREEIATIPKAQS